MGISVRRPGGWIGTGLEGVQEALQGGSPAWIDLELADLPDLAPLQGALPGHPLSWEDAGKPRQRPKLENHGDHLFLVVRGLDMTRTRLAGQLETVQLAAFLAPGLLVTIRSGAMGEVDLVKERMDRSGRMPADGADGVLHAILDALVDLYRPHVEAWEAEVERLEKEALHHPRHVILARILGIRKHMVHLRQTLASVRDVVAMLSRAPDGLVREPLRPYFTDVHDHLVAALEDTDTLRDSVLLAVDIYLNSLNNRTNQVMKVLTMMSAVLLPLTLLTGIFGMNFDSLPGLHHPGAFRWFVSISALVLLTMLGVFRALRWI